MRDIECFLLDKVKAQGATSAEVSVINSKSVQIGTRLGNFEKFNSSNHCSVSVRAFIGNKVASASSEDISKDGLCSLAERVVTMAKVAPENEFLRLPSENEVYKQSELNVFEDETFDHQAMLELAKETESTALQQENIFTSEGSEVSASSSLISICNSNGNCGTDKNVKFCNVVSVIAKNQSGEMESDYDFSIAPSLNSLKSADLLGITAANRASSKLGGKKIKSCMCDVIFDKRVSKQLLDYLISAINGHVVYKKASFLFDKFGQQIFDSSVNIIDDPLIEDGIRSARFDSELVKTEKKYLVKDGKLASFLLDIESANRLSMTSNGCSGGRSYNTYAENGNTSFDKLVKSIKDGVLITSVMGMGIDLASGNYSQGISGFKIENGEISYPVKEITLAGNMLEMFSKSVFANDLEMNTGCDSPSIFIPQMAIGGM